MIISPNMVYSWEMETIDGRILKQFEPNGQENKRSTFPPEAIMRVSYHSNLPLLPDHHCLIDHDSGNQYVKSFGTGIMALFTGVLQYYLYVVQTKHFRFQLLNNGQLFITAPNFTINIGGRNFNDRGQAAI